MAITTGMRQGELLGLKWIDVDGAASQLHIRRKVQRIPKKGFVFSPPKTQVGIRLIQLGPETMRQLIEHRQRQDAERSVVDWVEHDLVFPSLMGNPTDQRNLIRFFKRLLKRAGLPDIRFHDLRHTAATLMLLNGIPLIVVSRRLGHSKPSVTLDIYGHYIPGMQQEAASLMDELVTPIATKWQQIGSSQEGSPEEQSDLTPDCLNVMVECVSGSMVKIALALRVSINQFLDCGSRVTVKTVEKLSGSFSLS